MWCKFGDADEIVAGGSEDELPLNAFGATQFGLADPGNGLHPAKDFLDAFSAAMADGVSGMSGRSPITGAAFFLRGNVRGDALRAAGVNKGSDV